MNNATHAHVSVSAKLYARLTSAREARGVSITSLVEAALADLPPTEVEPREVLPISHRLYATAGKVARRRTLPIVEAFEAALIAALDDAERYPPKPRRTNKHPRVAHASRRAS
jgi:hypothetical protein